MNHFVTKLETLLLCAISFTLPWVGLGAVKVTTGIDTGAGFQLPFIAAAILFLLYLSKYRVQFTDFSRRSLFSTVAILLLMISGIFLAPGNAELRIQLLRFLKQIIQLLILMWIAFLPLIYFKDNKIVVLKWLLFGLVFQFVYSILQYIGLLGHIPFYNFLDSLFTSNPSILSGSEELFLGSKFTGIPRLRGTACEPLLFGNYLLLAIPLIIVFPMRKSLKIFLVSASIIMLLLTWSRGAWLGAIGAMVTSLCLLLYSGLIKKPSKNNLILMLSVFVPVLGVVFYLSLPTILWDRFLQSFDLSDWSNLTRYYSMQAGWRAFIGSPVIGIGWGQFAFHFDMLVDPLGLQSQFSWPVINNFPLKILVETGLVGFMAVVVCFVSFLKRLRQHICKQSPACTDDKIFVIALASSFSGIFIQLLTFSQYNLPHIWFGFGMLMCTLYRIEDK